MVAVRSITPRSVCWEWWSDDMVDKCIVIMVIIVIIIIYFFVVGYFIILFYYYFKIVLQIKLVNCYSQSVMIINPIWYCFC